MPEFPSYAPLSSPHPDDLLLAVDVHDQNMSPAGTTKQATVQDVLGNLVNLASASTARTNLGLGSAATQSASAFDAAGAATAVANAVAAEIGAASGIAPLDSSALLLKANLPYVIRSDYKFAPEEYSSGASDVIVVPDGAMTSGQPGLACTTSTPFTSDAVIGRYVKVTGAGAAGADLYARITARADSGHVTLSANASANVSGKGVAFGTDTIPAIRQAWADAETFTQGSPREAVVMLLGGGYGAASAPIVGGATLGNGMVPFSAVPVGVRKSRIRLAGDAFGAPLIHWEQQVPQINGPCVVVLRAPSSIDATNGPPSVFGGPYNGYGAAASLFSNMIVVVDGVSVAAPLDSGYLACDFFGLSEAVVVSGSKLSMATVGGTGGWPDLTSGTSGLTRTSTGVRMPDVNNNDLCEVLWWSTEGDVTAVEASEHTTIDTLRGIYCFTAMRMYGGAPSPHWARVRSLSAEACTWAVGVMPSGVTGFPGGVAVKVRVGEADIEGSGVLNDGSNLAQGYIGVTGNYTSSYDGLTVNGGTGVEIVDLAAPKGLVSSPHAAPLTGQPWANLYNGPVEVTVSISGGTLSALSLTSGSEIVPASCTWYRFDLASRHSYTPTFTGVLTHTVKRL